MQTSATMLPIRPNGERPALHVPGAVPGLERADVDLDRLGPIRALHVGGGDVLGGFGGGPLVEVLAAARAAGAWTTMDVLGPGDPQAWAGLRPALGHITYFLPNEEQLLRLTGADRLVDAAREAIALGVEAVLVSRGPEGCLLVTGDDHQALPALDVEVVDTTGCGDAVSAGFITGVLSGWSLEDAARLAMAAAALAAAGSGPMPASSTWPAPSPSSSSRPSRPWPPGSGPTRRPPLRTGGMGRRACPPTTGFRRPPGADGQGGGCSARRTRSGCSTCRPPPGWRPPPA